MSAFGGKADVVQGVAEGPLLANSGPKDEGLKSEIFQKWGVLETVSFMIWEKPYLVVPDDTARIWRRILSSKFT